MVRAGELIALVGPNGAGKTTLLRAISGLLRVSRGAMTFEGADINRPDPRKARWLYAEIAAGLRQPLDEAQARLSAQVFRPDLFDAATGNNALPETPDPIGLKFGPAFDSGDLQAPRPGQGNRAAIVDRGVKPPRTVRVDR